MGEIGTRKDIMVMLVSATTGYVLDRSKVKLLVKPNPLMCLSYGQSQESSSYRPGLSDDLQADQREEDVRNFPHHRLTHWITIKVNQVRGL